MLRVYVFWLMPMLHEAAKVIMFQPSSAPKYGQVQAVTRYLMLCRLEMPMMPW